MQARRRTTPASANPEVDKLLDEARLVSDTAERKAIYEKLRRDHPGGGPIVYLYHRRVI